MNPLIDNSFWSRSLPKDQNLQDQSADWSTVEDLRIVEVDGEPVNHCSTCEWVSPLGDSHCPNCGAAFI